MLEAFLREFPDAPAREKEAVQRDVAELRRMLGTINIEGAEPGAAIAIDGRNRGEYPVVEPLRVSAGSHMIRVVKEGFEPFQARVDVAGGQTALVTAALKPMLLSGRARVQERGGAALDVIVDGGVVGKTPWEGALSVGSHAVWLQGEGMLGSQPARIVVEAQKLTPLTLAAETLSASLSVDATPAGATIAIDSVIVGQGLWDGRLRDGSHTIEVAADGFLPKRRDLTLSKGTREMAKLSLDRDPDDPRFREPSKIVAEASVRFALSPSFGGDLAGCAAPCKSGVALGALANIYLGYDGGAGLGFGVSVGYIFAQQNIEDRPVALTPRGLSELRGSADEALRITGATLGVAASYRVRMKYPLLLRLGLGGVFGETGAARTATFPAADGSGDPSFKAPKLIDSRSSSMLYLAPEARIGMKPWDRVELSVGLTTLLLISPTPVRWGEEEPRPVVLPGYGLSTYPAESLTGEVIVIFAPGLTGRFDL